MDSAPTRNKPKINHVLKEKTNPKLKSTCKRPRRASIAHSNLPLPTTHSTHDYTSHPKEHPTAAQKSQTLQTNTSTQTSNLQNTHQHQHLARRTTTPSRTLTMHSLSKPSPLSTKTTTFRNTLTSTRDCKNSPK
ncbi:hypothetical protein KC19_10G078200 [Ceratodon purpureus]|uniref:Uncharacterized protein n=1 Tax=Ceratodon purpureus TaxID=3225 RepID=A0A8T0GMV7_CERPU|nr:hypothetical protein KC19_10G078200 [Ceratodon purpureus]